MWKWIEALVELSQTDEVWEGTVTMRSVAHKSHHICSMQVQMQMNAYRGLMLSSASCASGTKFESRMFIKAWQKTLLWFPACSGLDKDKLVAQETVDNSTSCHWAWFITGGCPVFERLLEASVSVQLERHGVGSFNNAKEAPTSPEAVPDPGAKALQWIRTYLRCFIYLLFDVVCTFKD